MRAWFLQGEENSDSDALRCLLRQWAGRPENEHWSVDCLRWTPQLPAMVAAHRPDVLLLHEPSCPSGSWLTETLGADIGVVVGTTLDRAAPYWMLAEQCALQVLGLPASVEGVGLAILSAAAARQRQRNWQARVDQLQQRLDDRILIERAKGILVERLVISEKEAYQRLRLQSRRQRRPIREIAQCLLDAQSLLTPEIQELVDFPRRNGQAHLEQPREEA